MGEPTERDQLFGDGGQRRDFQIVSQSVEEKRQVSPGWTFWLIVAGISTTFGGSLPVGYNIGVMNAPAEIIRKFCNESIHTRYDIILTEVDLDILWSAIVSVFLIGGVTGSLSGSFLADKIGRKGAYIVCCILNIAGGILFYYSKPANSVELLIIGRILVGLAGGLITATVPMYLTELAPLALRGGMGAVCPLGVTSGVLVAQIAGFREVLGTEETWPFLLAFFVVLAVIFGLPVPFLPESPKYLAVVKRKPQLALKELAKIRGLPSSSLTDEIQELEEELRLSERSEISWNIASVIRNKEFLLPILLVCFMQGGQQLSGINAVFYYSVSIFLKTGLNEQEAQLANMGCGCVNLLMAIIAIPVMSRFNRRPIFLISTITAAFWLIVLGVSIALLKTFAWMSYISIIAMLSYVLFYGIGLGPIPYFIGSELFEIGPRPSAMALGSMANWGGNFMVGMTFPTLQTAIGPGCFGIFAAITIALFFFIRRYFPETKGKDASEVAFLCKNGLGSRPLDTPTSFTDTAGSSMSEVKSLG